MAADEHIVQTPFEFCTVSECFPLGDVIDWIPQEQLKDMVSNVVIV